MKVSLDECVDWRLSLDITGHEGLTAHQTGWTAIKNGALLILAAQQFDVFVTVDRNLAFQQNTSTLGIAVVVLRSKSNRLADLKPLVPRLLAAIPSARPGAVQFIDEE